MFGSYVLEVAIGLVFVYMLVSLLCSTINEQVIARFLNLRAKTLEDAIKNMLADPQGNGLAKQLYENPLIKGLSQNAASGEARKPSYIPAKIFAAVIGKPRKPSYIPADIFALALMSNDVVQAYKNTPGAAKSPLPEALALLLDKTNIDPAKEQAKIEKWYNDTMDRVSGWYRRRIQLIIFVLGLLIVVGLNIDTLSIITTISNDTVIRSALVSSAQGSASSLSNVGAATLQKGFEQIQLVIGWSPSSLPADFWGWVLKIVGLLATTFAVSLGAPFWFDLLNKFMAFRSSGTPPQSNAGPPAPPVTTLHVVAGASASPTIAPPGGSTNGSTVTQP